MKHPVILPARKRRAESFLGVHFDFHAGDDCREVGRHVTRKMVEDMLRTVSPDYIQCDCKGHRGLSSYMTEVGYRAPGYVRDQLRIWREVTAKHGVALYMHYSGVWDTEAIRHHPSWARIDAQGKRDPNNTSVFGPYVDQLLIPQLKELCDVYGVDGVWIDGECWATAHDYGKRAVSEFRRKTGIRSIPKKPGDRGFLEFSDFCRDRFRRYLKHYVDELHRHDPRFQIASNWAYSSFMPEPVKSGVDFISGDYSLQNSVNAARLEGRCMTRQGRPWDLMAWSFAGRWGEKLWTTKTSAQLQQEAAVVLALGGGFQAYFRQRRDGSIHARQMQLMRDVAQFCRAREALSHKAEAIPQIGLILSSAAFYRKNARLFAPWDGTLGPLSGVLQALLDSQQSVEVLEEHHLAGRMDEYPLLILPEWDYLTGKFRRELKAYVRRGGNLLCVGPGAARLFRSELRVQLLGQPQESRFWLEQNGWLGCMLTRVQRVKAGRGARVCGWRYAEDDFSGPAEPTASVARYGRGKIAGIYFDMGQRYTKARTVVQREFLAALVRELFPDPLVTVSGSHLVDVTVMRKHGTLCVHLVNTAGPHADENQYTFDQIPPVGPLTIAVRTGRKPGLVKLQPDGRSLPFRYSRGVVTVRVARLEIHGIVTIE